MGRTHACCVTTQQRQGGHTAAAAATTQQQHRANPRPPQRSNTPGAPISKHPCGVHFRLTSSLRRYLSMRHILPSSMQALPQGEKQRGRNGVLGRRSVLSTAAAAVRLLGKGHNQGHRPAGATRGAAPAPPACAPRQLPRVLLQLALQPLKQGQRVCCRACVEGRPGGRARSVPEPPPCNGAHGTAPFAGCQGRGH